jgi:hypothetical protein
MGNIKSLLVKGDYRDSKEYKIAYAEPQESDNIEDQIKELENQINQDIVEDMKLLHNLEIEKLQSFKKYKEVKNTVLENQFYKTFQNKCTAIYNLLVLIENKKKMQEYGFNLN